MRQCSRLGRVSPLLVYAVCPFHRSFLHLPLQDPDKEVNVEALKTLGAALMVPETKLVRVNLEMNDLEADDAEVLVPFLDPNVRDFLDLFHAFL